MDDHDCIGIYEPNGTPGDRWTCPDCGRIGEAVDAGPLDIRWVYVGQSM